MTRKTSLDNTYDLILIGSGMGALTVASLMAQMRDKKVLVLERHFRAGGFTHSFRRQKFYWDVGSHYLGMMAPGSPIRDLFDLVTRNRVEWTKIPDPFDIFIYPEFTFKLRSGKDSFITDLSEKFPEEKKAIIRYVRDIYRASNAYLMQSIQRSSSLILNILGFTGNLLLPAQLNLTTKAYLDRCFQSKELKAILASQWGDYGLPPSLSPFALHATFVRHFIDGAYYPVGGAATIAATVQSIVEEKGGRFLLNREVTQVLIDNGQAIGVKVNKVNLKEGYEQEEYYYAPTIVSNAGTATTYLKLIHEDYPIPFRDSLRCFLTDHPPITSVGLYLGLSQDPEKLGFKGENHWIYSGLDHDEIYCCRSNWILDAKPSLAFLSFPSLKDPKAKGHTASILAWTDYKPFEKWREQNWLKRDSEYRELKQRLSKSLINLVEQQYPGFSDIIEYQELSTPVTNEFFTGHHRGGIYGFPFVWERFKPENLAWTHPKTPIPGLFLTGSDVYMSGIAGSMIGSAMMLGHLPDGHSFPQVFALHKLGRI